MDASEAIGILRGDETAYYTPSMLDEAKQMGAQALEAWAWVDRTGCSVRPFGRGWAASFVGEVNGHRVYMSSSQPTPLAAVLDAMEKEKGNG